MRTIPTFCRICEASCGLLADVEDNRVLALRPDPDHVSSKGFVCIKGVRCRALLRTALVCPASARRSSQAQSSSSQSGSVLGRGNC